MTLIGKPAPDFVMASTKNQDTLADPVALQDYAGRWLVMFFYPADFTFVCPTEAIAFSEAVPAFAELGADVIGVSTDGVHAHLAWMEFHVGQLAYPLAADRTQVVSRAYGVLNEAEGVAERGVFIIDPAGIVRYEAVHDDRVGRNVGEILRVLHALQAKGRIPANWTPDLVESAPAEAA
jgi:peroxiredoxin (alkyl hydroperoxide reductase subunit C)